MSSARVLVVRSNTYVDSVQLMALTRTLQDHDGVDWAAAVMGTPANVETLRGEGFEQPALAGVVANDLLIAARADSTETAEQALGDAERALDETKPPDTHTGRAAPRSLREAVTLDKQANVAIVSVPGRYAAIEAHKALGAGLHTLLFSDNVTLDDEIHLKRRAVELGLLLMGPGAGTSHLGGKGLGFCNAVRHGPVGVVAAAGTGAQEVMSLIHRLGSGTSNVIGTGGRDLHTDVDAAMTRLAVRALAEDDSTEVIVIVSKPPAPQVAERLIESLPQAKPCVVALLGLEEPLSAPPNVRIVDTLDAAVTTAVSLGGVTPASLGAGLSALASETSIALPDDRVAIRGLFSGGTLCFETMVLLSRLVGPVFSNTPLQPDWALPAPQGAHVCLDLGEEEFTLGRPHPMIDAQARVEHIDRAAAVTSSAVILLDVVLGYGSHPDPAGVLAPACERARQGGAGPAVVAYVLGTDQDPQGLKTQVDTLREAGCLVAPTAARAALLAAAIAARRPDLAEVSP